MGAFPKIGGPKTRKQPSFSLVFWGCPSHGLYPFQAQGKQPFWLWGVGGGKVLASVVQVGCFYISSSRGIWFFFKKIYPLDKAILVVLIFLLGCQNTFGFGYKYFLHISKVMNKKYFKNILCP
jgi:hypothetical protein